MQPQLPLAFVGIDPGAKGGVSIIDINENVLYCEPIPYVGEDLDARQFATVLSHFKKRYNLFAAFERVGALPGQGVCAMFSFGKTTGQLLATLKILAIPYTEPTPIGWKEVVLVGLPWKADTAKYKNDKKLSKEENERLKAEFKKLNSSANSKAKRDAKLVSCQYVFKRFPSLNIMRGKNPHDGMAESLCLAMFAKQNKLGNNK